MTRPHFLVWKDDILVDDQTICWVFRGGWLVLIHESAVRVGDYMVTVPDPDEPDVDFICPVHVIERVDAEIERSP